MSDEIFGPIMPILTFSDLSATLRLVNSKEKPLAFYYFSEDKRKAKWVLGLSPFGGGCLNDTIMYLTNESLPFGGVGQSGMGSYHGKKSFETFSHYRSIVDKATWLDLPMRYQPYTKLNNLLVRMFIH